MASFVWTKMQGQAGQTIEVTVARKEAERIAGSGRFWWGIGNNLLSLADEARRAEGDLTVLFSRMRSPAAKHDTNPENVLLWTKWKDDKGLHEIPTHIVCLSRAPTKPKAAEAICPGLSFRSAPSDRQSRFIQPEPLGVEGAHARCQPSNGVVEGRS
jgi:hypothetical protein